MQITLNENQLLAFAKGFIISLVILLTVPFGKIWPFIHWELYDKGRPHIPKTFRRSELRVLDSKGNWHSILLMDLYTLDDDSSGQPGSYLIFQRTFLKSPESWNIYRPYLIRHIENNFNIKIEKIEAYLYTWHPKYEIYPPINISRPSKSRKIDSFKSSDYFKKNSD